MKENNKKRYTEIDAERINIVDKNGQMKMAIFNNDDIPPALMDGKDILPGHRQDWPISGIMFYNGEGDECGGLIYGSRKKEDGEYESTLSLSFDQYKQDQVVQMLVSEESGQRQYGFHIFDRPDTSISKILEENQQINEMKDGEEKEKALSQLWAGNNQRAFMGKNQNGEVSVRLMDSKGSERIRMVIDANDVPKMEFLDENGEVIYSLPPSKDK